MTTIIVCRHGESEGNRERRFGGHGPTPLTERGRAQARAAATALARTPPDHIYTSDLVRAVETAALLAAPFGLEPRPTDRLRERSVGVLTGLTFEDAEKQHPAAYAALLARDPEAAVPGGESYRQTRERMVALVEELVIAHEDETLVLVSHHGAIDQLIRHILGLGHDAAAPRVFFRVDNCALHRFTRLSGDVWKLDALGERAHLDL
jgi:probable phosphoglycerate mutase